MFRLTSSESGARKARPQRGIKVPQEAAREILSSLFDEMAAIEGPLSERLFRAQVLPALRTTERAPERLSLADPVRRSAGVLSGTTAEAP